MYARGKGVTQDYKEAVKWYRLAAEQGYANGQYNLGWMYYYGKGVIKDYKKTIKWYSLAAEQGVTKAQYAIGYMYVYGKGVIEDKVIAHMWWSIAISHGYEHAKKNKDKLVELMTISQIEEAQRLERECISNDYKGC